MQVVFDHRSGYVLTTGNETEQYGGLVITDRRTILTCHCGQSNQAMHQHAFLVKRKLPTFAHKNLLLNCCKKFTIYVGSDSMNLL